MLVHTVDNPIAYHNFNFPSIRVSPSAFLFVAWCNTSHGTPVKRAGVVANNLVFDGVIFNCHNLDSSFSFVRIRYV